MEHGAVQASQGIVGSSQKNGKAETIGPQGDAATRSSPRRPEVDIGAGSNSQKAVSVISEDEILPVGEVNMEASIGLDDVIRAGGLGARDDMSSFLPVASDSTDFEATILDARSYEESQADTRRPGLGWKENSSGRKEM